MVGRDPVLKILHMKIFQGGAQERPKEKKELLRLKGEMGRGQMGGTVGLGSC